ncbi:MAG: ORC1-type DNA replication protein [Methanophagales archaeon]|nr:ORC1-type DNA replication protein [Methanophagales archaeon]
MTEEHLREGEIFADKAVLRSTYIPENLPHRVEQIATLTNLLSTALKEKAPTNILIYGKTGTGKTATVKYVSKQLEEMAQASNCPLIYINCELFYTQHRVLGYLARFFNKRVPVFGWPTDEVYSELKKRIDTEDRYVVVILDEMDKLVTKEDEVLYNLLRINSDLNKARVSVIGISNNPTFSELLDQRVKSLSGMKEIVFPAYNADQLKDILTERAAMAFNYSALDDAVIPLCVALAAKQDGDAKYALDLLLISGEIAERSKSKKVSEEHVRIASEKTEDSIVEVVKTLPLQQKILLSSVLTLMREKNERSFISGDVYNMYHRLCDHLGVEVLTQRRLIDLISELDIFGLINAVIMSRGKHGRTKEISLNVPEELIQPVLFADPELKALSDIRVRA